MKKFQNIFSEKKLSYEENAVFFESLSELINAGIPFIHIFDISDINLKNNNILSMIKADIQKGNSLSSSLENTNVFSDIAISVLQVGEESGKLKISLEKLSKYYYKMSEIKKNIIASLFYPAILLISILILLIFINYYFIPSIVNLYNYDMDSLNTVTKIIFLISLFFNKYKIESNLLLFSIFILTFIFINEIYKDRNNSNIFQKLPLISQIAKLNTMSNLSWAYFVMLTSGIDVRKSTNILKNQTKNKTVKEKLDLFEKNINLGKSLKSSIEELNLKDEKLIYFISLAEQSGNMEKYIEILSDMYAKNLNKSIKYISQIIQPLLIVIITFIVGMIISAVILPMLNYEAII